MLALSSRLMRWLSGLVWSHFTKRQKEKMTKGGLQVFEGALLHLQRDSPTNNGLWLSVKRNFGRCKILNRTTGQLFMSFGSFDCVISCAIGVFLFQNENLLSVFTCCSFHPYCTFLHWEFRKCTLQRPFAVSSYLTYTLSWLRTAGPQLELSQFFGTWNLLNDNMENDKSNAISVQ